MNAKVSTIVALCIVVAICVLQALYSEQLGTLAARSIAKSPRPVRRFYTWTSFGKPLDGPFWNRARRVLSLIVGSLFVIAIGALLLS